jgi:hypothetical protein
MTVDGSGLVGRWVHSHEEDTDGEVVYRPSTFAFPRSRGRAALELRADGTYSETAIGADDRAAPADGTWEVHGTLIRLTPSAPDASVRTLDVLTTGADRLTFRR